MTPEVRGAHGKQSMLAAKGVALVSPPNLAQIGDAKTHECVFAESES
jgi:hypothetical protein